MEKEIKPPIVPRITPLWFSQKRNRKKIYAAVVLIVVIMGYLWLSLRYPYMFEIGGDSFIHIRSSSAIFLYGDQGSVFGRGLFGQYWISGGGSGGCCSSSDILAYFGKPKGEIAVRWQALYEQPEVSKYYYAYDPNPGIKVPPKGPQHSKYMIFFSFGQLALKRETLTDEQLKLSTLSDLGYQLGTPNTFYFKVVSNSSLDSWSFSEMPLEEFQSIKGIEVTEEQYDYIIKHKYLDENAPNLTPEQLNYIKQQNSKKSLSYYLNKLLPEPTVFFEYH